MPQVNLPNLIAKLDPTAKRALELAAGDAMNTHCPAIELEHWLMQLIYKPDTQVTQFFTSQKIEPDAVIKELSSKLTKLNKGFEGQPSLSGNLTELIKSAWLCATVDFSHDQLTTLHIILASQQVGDLGTKAITLKSLDNFSESALRNQISKLKVAHVGTKSMGASTPGVSSGDALEKYTTNLTQAARDGQLDSVLGRNQEVRTAIDILCRKRQNNPIFVGEPGVGKTAVVEGLAIKIAQGEVPGAIKGVEIHSLDLGLLQAGASVKGEFENRLKDVINEVKTSEKPIVVFIDEAHTLIGAGGAEGQNDAANLLKPALARGEFRTLAATTWDEYKKYFEKDPALTRRFQVVKVEEPNAADSLQILRGVAESLQKHHNVYIRESAVEAAVNLSIRYLPARMLPDKAISLLDTSCARIALTQGAKPEAIESLEQNLLYSQNELEVMQRESSIFDGVSFEIDKLKQKILEIEQALTALNARWENELELVQNVIELQRLVTENLANETPDENSHKELNTKLVELESLQAGEPLVNAMVDDITIAQVIASWTGIPIGNMLSDEVKKLLSIEENLHKRVIGQSTAISELAKSIRISRAGLTDSRKPIGVFLMCGPSGVGKTETAVALTDLLYGGSNDMTVINMTEFKEEHKISMLLGAPAGYVGFGKGGVLTEAVRRNPYSVLLLDEMEKAHPGVHDLFYQIFDKGSIADSEGRNVDFRNTIIIMTSNAADQAICDVCDAHTERLPNEELVEEIRPALQQYFKPAFLGRATVVPYYPLNDEELGKICDIALNRIRKKLVEQYKASFNYDASFVQYVVNKNNDPTTGARGIEQIINRSLMPRLAEQCITLLSEGKSINTVTVKCADEGDFEVIIES
ncbi:type VI secretion system ATPase TssH [Pseudoalteromonas denitrificans]|uniref:Type VI secretion system protein VasG n=1 Tax=Pseudoalteromonas denitrificans DSM 6059 TaxID=1123010 RepID=A0A1I1GLC9_9GAMM|nr:type VI secretion system ATPase TssH [Pseudoalteromonas denitrificans]SFC12579.1 type VI secretion system protein VasG [Pseudoalteromonas denitrificans DSM 6059]